MTDTSARPGFWHSSLDENAVVAAAVEYTQPLLSEEGIAYWVEYRPEAQGRNLLCRYWQGAVQTLTLEGYSVRSRVHEYGGQSWCLLGNDALVFVNAEDQQLYLQQIQTGQLKQLTQGLSNRYIEPVWDARRNRLLCVQETHQENQVINRLVTVSLNTGQITVLHQGLDFYAYPTLSPEADKLTFICWNHPNQPWLETECYLAELTDSGDFSALDSLGAAGVSESLSQPYFSASGELFVVSDRSGFWNVHPCDGNALLDAHYPQPADMINAPWQSGLRHYGVLADGRMVSIRYSHQSAELCIDNQTIPVEGYSHFKNITVQGDQVLAIAAGADRLPAVLLIDACGKSTLLTGGHQPLADQGCSLPRPMSFTAPGEAICYGYFYSPANAACASVGQPPLVIFLHGGPTAASYPVLNLKIQYWTQRGFAVLDLNYRGSSNYGREYRLALKGRWGVAEIEDIQHAVSQLVQQGLVNRRGLFIRGNSSGGFSALNALCDLDLFTAGASLYGVTDPVPLIAATHKFESHYLQWLIGDPQTDRATYSAVTPLQKVDAIRCPVIFFQGEQDAVVVPEQTRCMVSALRQNGVEVEAHYFADEAHGFRQSANQETVLRLELAFYQRYLSGAPGKNSQKTPG